MSKSQKNTTTMVHQVVFIIGLPALFGYNMILARFKGGDNKGMKIHGGFERIWLSYVVFEAIGWTKR